MGAGHAHALYVHEHSHIHHLAPEVKLAATVGFVVCVALTPREQMWAFGIYVALLGVVVAVAKVRAGFVATRLVAIVPFVLFAVMIPFVATGEQVEVLGVSVAREGLWGAWNILAKASLGAGASILLAATTEVPEIIRGLGVLRVPPVITAIASFMVRYLEMISGELSRMRTAMVARGYDPRWLWQTKPIAASAGALFIRSYERGERVHAAMLSRGYTGTMPLLNHRAATSAEWRVGLILPFVALVVLLVAVVA